MHCSMQCTTRYRHAIMLPSTQLLSASLHALPPADADLMWPLKVRAAARWLGTSLIRTSLSLGCGSVALVNLLGITKLISTSPEASLDSASLPDMSMRTGELCR